MATGLWAFVGGYLGAALVTTGHMLERIFREGKEMGQGWPISRMAP
jgi:hypothetical protein